MKKPISGKLVDGLFRRVLAGDVTVDLKGTLAMLGLDLSPARLEPEYPRALWYEAVAATAKALYGNQAPEQQLRHLGLHVIDSLQRRHIVKGPWIAMARLAGPRRALRQATEYLDHSPVKLVLNERSKTEFEIVVEDHEQPEFLAGLLEGAITLLGGKHTHVVVAGQRGHSTVFSATWR
jgi:uncharacterized protein (TIGR02265 family)